jgi:hypothetical protein
MQDRADREETIVVVLGGSLCGAAEYDLAAALRKAGSIFRRRTRSINVDLPWNPAVLEQRIIRSSSSLA